ncbi:hypothetical protein FZC78_02000 [Rossellomorea vietnamensis]|uniref:Uncharacterized protein n=2 Tax=Rossellomorea TaxID=2837508 RepID=A0A5D4NZS4_9BACI|nr:MULTISPECIES: hypothetical protein [Rossellomorea]TYS19825.1 hypothetical protein FZC78_02000 [Rossellomorea vietnamensis]TYS84251.1 hypothetical protein FZC80_01855 [Rossellomorea aquimaris]
MQTYSTFFKALSVPFSVISLRWIDQYVYDLSTLEGGILAGCLVSISYFLIERIPGLERELNKKMDVILSLIVFFSIFAAFKAFAL